MKLKYEKPEVIELNRVAQNAEGKTDFKPWDCLAGVEPGNDGLCAPGGAVKVVLCQCYTGGSDHA